MITHKTIRDMIKRLPGAEEGTSYNTPAFKVKKKLFARLHQEEGAVVVMLNSVDDQQDFIVKNPEHCYITDHYDGYAAVLVRDSIDDDAFFKLLEHAWRRVAGKANLEAYDR